MANQPLPLVSREKFPHIKEQFILFIIKFPIFIKNISKISPVVNTWIFIFQGQFLYMYII